MGGFLRGLVVEKCLMRAAWGRRKLRFGIARGACGEIALLC